MNYAFCTETQECRRKRESKNTLLCIKHKDILFTIYIYELEKGALPFTAVNKREFSILQITMS